MRHDWIFEVLKDLKAYALANGLTAVAAKAEEALRIARAEIAAAGGKEEAGSETEGGGGQPPLGRPH